MAKVIRLPNGELKQDERSNGGNVSWKVFTWAMVILLGLFTLFWSIYSYGHTAITTRLELVEKSHLDIKCQLASIQQDLLWIRQSLQGYHNDRKKADQ